MGVEAVRRLLRPRNVVIIGATPRPGGWAERIYRNLRRFEFPHPVYLVNPRYQTIWDQPCYPSVKALPEPPDHAVLLVPAEVTLAILEEAAHVGLRSATVYAGGFGEGGDEEGQALACRLKAFLEQSGVALSGPNCLGNLSAPSKLVTLTDTRIESLEVGPVAILGQSGGVVLFVNGALHNRGVAVSYALSTGNELGLTSADYLEFLAEDESVRVVVAFLETLHDAERFFSACLTLKRAGKELVVLKIGGSEASRRAAGSHTGALAGSLEAFDAVAREYGVLRVDNLDEAVEAADYLAHSKPPRGPRIAAVTYSGGLRELLLESAHRHHIGFAPLDPSTVENLRAVLPPTTAVENPLDTGWSGLSNSDLYFRCVDILRQDPNVDAVMVQEQLPVRPHVSRSEAYLRGLEELAGQPDGKPVAAFSMVSTGVSEYGRQFRRSCPHLPVLQEVDRALRTVYRLGQVAAWRSEGRDALPLAYTPRLRSGLRPQALDEVESKARLRACGLPCPTEYLVHDPQEAVARAEELGFPVVLKAVSPGLLHKSDHGLVLLNVVGAPSVAQGFLALRDRLTQLGADWKGVLVSPLVQGGLELALGLRLDPEVGPVVLLGRGGVELELYRDYALSPLPVTPRRLARLLEETKVGAILRGYRRGPGYDQEAIFSALKALEAFALRYRDGVHSVDINPFVVFPQGEGGLALDALVMLYGA